MKIKIIRKYRKTDYTIGEMYIDGSFFCSTLEDKDRGLRSDMSLDEIKKIKIKGETAIPTGRYKIKMTYWAKYKKYYPEICGVPGFVSILIHAGANNKHTEGCPLVGENKIKGGLINGGKYVEDLRKKITAELKAGKEVWITIE